MRIAPETNLSLDGVINALFPKNACGDIPPEKLAIGILVELEHFSNREEAEKIARDHLAENPNYYTDPMKKNWGAEEALDRLDELAKAASTTGTTQQIFVLEDDPERVTIFKNAFGSSNVVITKDVKEALDILRTKKFAKVFLDRDLSSSTENGEDVAWQMEQEKLCSETPVVIHSENVRGQKVMARYIGRYHSDVSVIPFRELRKSLEIPGGINAQKTAQTEVLDKQQEQSKKWYVKVTFDNGNSLGTTINGTQDEIKHYYYDNVFVDNDEITRLKVINVEFIGDLGAE